MPYTEFFIGGLNKIFIPDATQSASGFMSAADKTRFDAGFTLATNYTAGTVAADQTLIIQAADGGPVIFSEAAVGTGTLVRAQMVSGATFVTLFDISDNSSQILRSGMADGVAAVAVILDTTTAWASGKLVSVRNNANEQAYFDPDGFLTPGASQSSTATPTVSWTAPTFTNNWVNFGGGYSNAFYTRDALGIVRIRGVIKDGTVNTSAFTLPAGYRPVAKLSFSILSSGIGAIGCEIDTTGTVTPTSGNAAILLDGITFFAEN